MLSVNAQYNDLLRIMFILKYALKIINKMVKNNITLSKVIPINTCTLINYVFIGILKLKHLKYTYYTQ